MFSNNLYAAYEYERERRNEERRAALESHRARELGGRSKSRLPSPMKFAGILVVLMLLVRMF